MKDKTCLNKKFVSGVLPKYLKIISDTNRMKILCLLKDGELCVCEIVDSLGIAQNLISSHLKILKDLKLISNRQEGKRIYYFINSKVFKKYNTLLINFLKNYE